jgi:hypothetical protein
MRFFNTAGPVRCEVHYCLPPLTRFDLNQVLMLIDQQKYFVLHAPRQTGKTTYLLALMEYLNQEGRYRCLYFNVEAAQSAREDVRRGMQAILEEMALQARTSLSDPFVRDNWPQVFERSGEHAALNTILTLWAEHSPQPLVLLIDEIDALVGDTLIAVLRQLRAGYTKRPALFPQSVVLCGVRDVRDYRIHSAREKEIITGGSAFNIKAESLRMGDFSRAEVETLYEQHTQETGQVFEPEALQQVWELTQGQPWLVNTLGYETCFKMESGRDRSQPITTELITEAKERLILRRETHIDQLVDKLKEARVRRVISPMLRGDSLDRAVSQDDIQYVIDLGLVRRREMGLQIANPIYREVIPRELGFIVQLDLESSIEPMWYVAPDGRLDMNKLLAAFQEFFREHSEHWVERFDYKEAGPQLLLQAFLQRIVNQGGRVEREYGLGRRRTDLLVIWAYPGGVQKTVIETKVLYRSLERTISEGLVQTWEYMDRCGVAEGHLVIFDRTEGKPWEEKLFGRLETYRGMEITVWGM